jgi:hypothetical protein
MSRSAGCGVESSVYAIEFEAFTDWIQFQEEAGIARAWKRRAESQFEENVNLRSISLE